MEVILHPRNFQEEEKIPVPIDINLLPPGKEGEERKLTTSGSYESTGSAEVLVIRVFNPLNTTG
jgi:hypothetical protein